MVAILGFSLKAGTGTVKIQLSVEVYGAEVRLEGHKKQCMNGITR